MKMFVNEFTARNASGIFRLIENGQHNETTWGQQIKMSLIICGDLKTGKSVLVTWMDKDEKASDRRLFSFLFIHQRMNKFIL